MCKLAVAEGVGVGANFGSAIYGTRGKKPFPGFVITLCMPASADSLCKQFEPRSRSTECLS